MEANLVKKVVMVVIVGGVEVVKITLN